MSDDNDEMAQMFAGSRFAGQCRVDMSSVNADEIAFAKRVRVAQREREEARRNQRERPSGGEMPTVTMLAGEVTKTTERAAADLSIETGPERWCHL